MSLYDFYIIGEQKCGTTWLRKNLLVHPQIRISDYESRALFKSSIKKNILKKNREYLYGDSSPEYLISHDYIIPKLLNINKKSKIIIMIRDPIDRAVSQYRMQNNFKKNVYKKLNDMTLYEALIGNYPKDTYLDWGVNVPLVKSRIGMGSLKNRSLYMDNIVKYMNAFGKENVLIIIFDDIALKPNIVLADVFKFLNIKPYISNLSNKIIKPKTCNSNKKILITKEEFLVLVDIFKEDITKLEKYLGRNLNWLNINNQPNLIIKSNI